MFFNNKEHASTFIIQKTGHIFNGIFDKDYVETQDVSGFYPTITCASKDLVGLVRDDVIEHNGTLYKFIEDQADGTGVSLVVLRVS